MESEKHKIEHKKLIKKEMRNVMIFLKLRMKAEVTKASKIPMEISMKQKVLTVRQS